MKTGRIPPGLPPERVDIDPFGFARRQPPRCRKGHSPGSPDVSRRRATSPANCSGDNVRQFGMSRSRLTRVMRSRKGSTHTTPGPRTPMNWPSRMMATLSPSFATRTLKSSTTKNATASITALTDAPFPPASPERVRPFADWPRRLRSRAQCVRDAQGAAPGTASCGRSRRRGGGSAYGDTLCQTHASYALFAGVPPGRKRHRSDAGSARGRARSREGGTNRWNPLHPSVPHMPSRPAPQPRGTASGRPNAPPTRTKCWVTLPNSPRQSLTDPLRLAFALGANWRSLRDQRTRLPSRRQASGKGYHPASPEWP